MFNLWRFLDWFWKKSKSDLCCEFSFRMNVPCLHLLSQNAHGSFCLSIYLGRIFLCTHVWLCLSDTVFLCMCGLLELSDREWIHTFALQNALSGTANIFAFSSGLKIQWNNVHHDIAFALIVFLLRAKQQHKEILFDRKQTILMILIMLVVQE